MRKKPTHEMVNGSTKYTFAGWMSEFPEEIHPMLNSVINKLGNENKPGDVNTMVRIYTIPEGTKQGDEIYPKEWVQTAGTAERLTVEVKRREVDGSYRQYTVGRPSASGELAESELIQFGEHQLPVRSSEVLTASDAIGIFQHYYDHHAVPEGWNLRLQPEFSDDVVAAQLARQQATPAAQSPTPDVTSGSQPVSGAVAGSAPEPASGAHANPEVGERRRVDGS